MKIATLYHASAGLAMGGIPTYLNTIQEHGKLFNFQIDNFGFYKYAKDGALGNKRHLIKPIEIYNDKTKLLDKLNEYDIVIMYFPPTKLNTTEQEISTREFVFDIWKNIKAVKVVQMHLAMYGQKLKPHPFIHEVIEYCDVTMSRSKHNPVAELGNALGKPWVQLKLFYDFDQFESKEKKNQICSFGRPVGCKKLKPLEKAKTILENYMTVIPADGVMKHKEGLEMFAESKILFCPTLAKAGHEYANQLEYVQMEGLANDCILVLNKLQGEHCYHEGVRWIDIPNFALWFDEKDLEGTWNKIIEVMQDPEATKKFSLAKNKFREELKIENFERQMNYIKNIKQFTK